MNKAFLLSFSVFQLFSFSAFSQSSGQSVIDKKNTTTGFTREAFTLGNSQIIGRTSAGALSGLTLGTGLTLTGTTLTAAGGTVTWSDITGKPIFDADPTADTVSLRDEVGGLFATRYRAVESGGTYISTLYSGVLEMENQSSLNILSVVPPASLTGNITLTWPSATGTMLTNNSSLAAANLTGTINTARLGTGTASSTTYLRGDGTWATVTGGVTSVTGTANEITVTGTTTPVLSIPSALTFTGKTITGGTFSSPTITNLTTNQLTLSGNISSAAWTTTGLRIKGIAATLTDTTSTGTVAAAYSDALGGNTIAATNATTFTHYITAFYREPVAGTNVTLTNKWALGAESLRVGTSNQLTISATGILTATSPVFTTPALGTPSSVTLTNATGLPAAGVTGTALTLAGGTLTGALTMPNAIYSGLSLTSAQATNTLDLSTTWNTTGNPSLIYGRATNTASGATARLIDLGTAAGGSLFSVTKAGFVRITSLSSAAAPALAFTDSGDSGWFSPSGGNIYFGGASRGVQFGMIRNGNGTFQLAYNGRLEWTSGPADSGTLDTFLAREAAATLVMGIKAATGTPVAQMMKGPDGTAGQTNQAGGNLTISSGLSTGNGAASVIIATSANTAGSTTLNSSVTRLTANAAGVAIGANGTASATIKHGIATLTAGTVTVSDSDVLSTSRIFINRQTDGGTIGDSYSVTRSAGVSFTITSKTANLTVTGDTSTVSYLIINP
jgi:hypothetical protein